MSDATFVLDDFTSFDRRPLSRRHSSRTVAAASLLALALVGGAWMLEAPPRAVQPAPAARPATRATAGAPRSPAAAPLAFAFSLGVDPLPLERSAPLSSDFVATAPARATELAVRDVGAAPEVAPAPPVADDVPLPEPSPLAGGVPLPEPRPPLLRGPTDRSPPRGPARQLARHDLAATPSAATPDNRGFLEKFFGMLRPSGPALAYAAPEDGLLGNSRNAVVDPALPHDRWTAVYDISAHTVYMPDGTRLEAHSGLGELLDDPRHVDARNRGATPPHLYDLQLREQPFHGVQALRLNPVGGSGVFGRTGLLAHTYMLGPKGDSNGCVSFRDYRAFLQAYANGQVKRLVVVAGID